MNETYTIGIGHTVTELFWDMWERSERSEPQEFEWITIDELLEEDEG